jgi:hypothetical protein
VAPEPLSSVDASEYAGEATSIEIVDCMISPPSRTQPDSTGGMTALRQMRSFSQSQRFFRRRDQPEPMWFRGVTFIGICRYPHAWQQIFFADRQSRD